MNDTYWNTTIVLHVDEDSLIADFKRLLCQYGLSEIDIVEDLSSKQLNKAKFNIYFDDVNKCECFVDKLKAIKKYNFDICIDKLNAHDWKTKWREDLPVIDLVGNYQVFSADKHNEYYFDDKKIFIDTDIVFGVGNHPTTRLVANCIYKLKGQFESLLDIGTGTGILSILASRLGAKKIWAVDIESDAVRMAHKNFICNRCNVDLLDCCDFSKFTKYDQFDFVVANVLSKYLVVMKDKIIEYVKPNGYLVVSGISSKNYDWFKKSFSSNLLEIIDDIEDDGWHAFLYKKMG